MDHCAQTVHPLLGSEPSHKDHGELPTHPLCVPYPRASICKPQATWLPGAPWAFSPLHISGSLAKTKMLPLEESLRQRCSLQCHCDEGSFIGTKQQVSTKETRQDISLQSQWEIFIQCALHTVQPSAWPQDTEESSRMVSPGVQGISDHML